MNTQRSAPTSGWREAGLGLAVALAIMAPAGGLGVLDTTRVLSEQRRVRESWLEANEAHDRLVNAAPLPVVPAAAAGHGRDVFAATCVACHGESGGGLKGLRLDLTASHFVARQSDAQLLEFLKVGRVAKPTSMPARGGREDLTDADLRDVVTYLRGLQDPRRMPVLPAPVALAAAPPSEAAKAEALTAAGGDAELAKYIASGHQLFDRTCITCHGKGGVGIQGNGKALAGSKFVQSQDDDHLLAFLKVGRAPGTPENTTGIQMPPKGGNPALSEDDLLDIIAYLRTLQGQHGPASAKQ